MCQRGKIPPAGAGCAQTRGFRQSCDRALLLLVSYVIPIPAMCSPHYNYWPKYGNCDQLPEEADFSTACNWCWDDRGGFGWSCARVNPSVMREAMKNLSWGRAFGLGTCHCCESLLLSQAAVKSLPLRQSLAKGFCWSSQLWIVTKTEGNYTRSTYTSWRSDSLNLPFTWTAALKQAKQRHR